jgi:hypothetical protein
MKRSEMVENIASELVIFYPKFNYDVALELADIILIRIEKDGMLPPPVCGRVKVVINNDVGTLILPLWHWEN